MRLKHYSSEKFRGEIIDIVGKHLDINRNRIFFFGSRITGKGNERSDIDIGIEGTEEIPWQIMARIREDIENLPVLYKVDVVDFKKVSPDFYGLATRDIEIL